MIERIYTMSDIRVIGNDIFYQGVKVGSVNEDSHQALDFRNILDEGMDEVTNLAQDWSMYNSTIANILYMVNELKDCKTIKQVRTVLNESKDDIEDLKELEKDLSNALFYFTE